MKVIVQEEWFSIQQCIDNPKNVYIFGDNTQRVGEGGQAQIRRCSNSMGVATKRAPSMNDGSFFNDSINDFVSMFNDLITVYGFMHSEAGQDYTIIFPVDGLGTGLSELPQRSPFINNQLKLLLEQYFNIVTRKDGTLCYFKCKEQG